MRSSLSGSLAMRPDEKVREAGSYKAYFASIRKAGRSVEEEMEKFFSQENGLFDLIGLKVEEVREGRSAVTFGFSHYVSGREGNRVAGGVIMFALDVASTLAVMTLNGTSVQATLEMKTNFLKPLKADPFRVTASVLRTGRSIFVVQGEARDSNGDLCAASLGTWYVSK